MGKAGRVVVRGRPVNGSGEVGPEMDVPASAWRLMRFPLASKNHANDTFWNNSGQLACVEIKADPERLRAAVDQLSLKNEVGAPGPKPGKRGPTAGQVDHYGKADCELFPELEELKGSEGSVTAAAKKLAWKIAGGGTTESKVKRLVRRYRKTL